MSVLIHLAPPSPTNNHVGKIVRFTYKCDHDRFKEFSYFDLTSDPPKRMKNFSYRRDFSITWSLYMRSVGQLHIWHLSLYLEIGWPLCGTNRSEVKEGAPSHSNQTHHAKSLHWSAAPSTQRGGTISETSCCGVLLEWKPADSRASMSHDLLSLSDMGVTLQWQSTSGLSLPWLGSL